MTWCTLVINDYIILPVKRRITTSILPPAVGRRALPRHTERTTSPRVVNTTSGHRGGVHLVIISQSYTAFRDFASSVCTTTLDFSLTCHCASLKMRKEAVVYFFVFTSFILVARTMTSCARHPTSDFTKTHHKYLGVNVSNVFQIFPLKKKKNKQKHTHHAPAWTVYCTVWEEIKIKQQ